MSLKDRTDKLRPLFEAAAKNELPAGRVVFYDPHPGHGDPGIYTDDANKTASALWVTAKAAYERRKVPLWAGVLERTLTDLEAIASWVTEQTK
jgi:hypothetical protein